MTFDLIDKRLGDYIVERQIAIGGMATIYLGRDVKLGRSAAIKVLLPDVASRDDTLTARFEREARAIGQLEHENIIPIFQFGEQDGLYFLAMRYVEGDDLANVLTDYHNQGQLIPLARALKILDQVAAALDYAHLKGIVHRDVKPSNVLLAADDRVYLSDFGLVLYSTGDQTLGTAFGTPRYISPEQATDSTLSTAKSDIYSLAVIVYEMVTGQRLFRGKTPMEIALSHITEVPQPPRTFNPTISSELQSVILRSLEKDPNMRHHSAREFVDELRTAHERSLLTPYRPSDPTETDGSETGDTRVLLAIETGDSTATPVPKAPPVVPMPVSTSEPTASQTPRVALSPVPSIPPVVAPAAVSIPLPTRTPTLPARTPTLASRPIAPTRANRGLLLLLSSVAMIVIVAFAFVSVNQMNANMLPTLAVLGQANGTQDGLLPPVQFTATSPTPRVSVTSGGSSSMRVTVASFPLTPGTATTTPSPTTTLTPTITVTVPPSATITETTLAEEVTEIVALDPTSLSSTQPVVASPIATLTRTSMPTLTPRGAVVGSTATSQAPMTRTPRPTATDTPSATPTDTVPTVFITGQLVLRYTPDLFAVTNISELSQDLRPLAFIGSNETDSFFNSVATIGDSIGGESCVLLLLSGRSAPVPANWGCTTARSVVLNEEAVFWRADDARDQVFTMELGALSVDCPTVGRAVGRLGEGICEVN